ncbi:MAG TPA: hypothetical protein VHA82_13875 [Ramlibacter sp.]|nr:hypothetical protein [Ramlibacter sp.]
MREILGQLRIARDLNHIDPHVDDAAPLEAPRRVAGGRISTSTPFS